MVQKSASKGDQENIVGSSAAMDPASQSSRVVVPGRSQSRAVDLGYQQSTTDRHVEHSPLPLVHFTSLRQFLHLQLAVIMMNGLYLWLKEKSRFTW